MKFILTEIGGKQWARRWEGPGFSLTTGPSVWASLSHWAGNLRNSTALKAPSQALASVSLSPPNTYKFYSTLKAHLSRSGQGSGPVWLLAHLYREEDGRNCSLSRSCEL